MCQTGNRSVEVDQEPFYTRNSSDIILGDSSHSHPAFANMFLKCPHDPSRSQRVSQRAVGRAHVRRCQSKRESFHGWALFRGQKSRPRLQNSATTAREAIKEPLRRQRGAVHVSKPHNCQRMLQEGWVALTRLPHCQLGRRWKEAECNWFPCVDSNWF